MAAEARNAAETAYGQYRVLRSFKGKDRTYQPGEVIQTDATWPWNRATDLTSQRYLAPIAMQPRRGREDAR